MMPARRLVILGCLAFTASLLSAQPMRPASLDLVSALTVGAVLPVRQPGPQASVPAGIVNAAMRYLGAPYVSGGNLPGRGGLLRSRLPRLQ